MPRLRTFISSSSRSHAGTAPLPASPARSRCRRVACAARRLRSSARSAASRATRSVEPSIRPSKTSGTGLAVEVRVAENVWKRCVISSRLPGAHHVPCTAAGTIHRWMRETFSLPTALSGTSTVRVRSGSQSPMSQSWETTRVPGASARRRGRSCRLTAGSRYIVTTLARPRSVANRSCSRNSTRSCTPATRASSRLFFTSSGTISTPRPRAPKRRAAVMTMRPSPEPRSISVIGGADGGELEHRQRHLVGRGDEGHLLLPQGDAGQAQGRDDCADPAPRDSRVRQNALHAAAAGARTTAASTISSSLALAGSSATTAASRTTRMRWQSDSSSFRSDEISTIVTPCFESVSITA